MVCIFRGREKGAIKAPLHTLTAKPLLYQAQWRGNRHF